MNEIKIGSVWRHKELGTETMVIDVDEKYVEISFYEGKVDYVGAVWSSY